MPSYRIGAYNQQEFVYYDDVTTLPVAPQVTGGLVNVANWVYDAGALNWVKETQPGAGAGGGPATIADGADVAQGALADVAYVAGSGSVVSILKGIFGKLGAALSVTVSNFPATQPVSLAAGVDVTDRAGRLVGVVSAANLDVALSTRIKPADTLAGVTSLTQFNGQAISMGTGARAAGTLRVTVATDDLVPVSNAGLTNIDAALSTRLKPADTLAGLTNLVQLNGAAIAMNTGLRAAGVQRVTICTDDSVPVTNANLDAGISTRLKPADTLAGVTTVTTVTAVSSVNAVVPGTGATNLGKAEDGTATTGDVGVMALGVRNDLEANQTSADGDYAAFAVDVAGRTRTREISNLIATTLSGANAGVTLTLGAAGAGLFHYITSIEIVNVNPTAAAIAGSAVTLGYTSTNIPGAPAWTAGNALAAGAEKIVERIAYPGGVKTTAANTATTIVAPAIGAGGLCRINATYYIAP